MYDEITVARFWSKVAVTKDVTQCWLWTGAVRGGYGNIKISGVNHNANRVAWEFFNKKRLGVRLALHHCDNPLCCNPRHIYAGTRSDNAADLKHFRYDRAGVSATPRDRGRRLGRSDVDYIVNQNRKGVKVARIAEEYGAPYSTIHSIIKRNT